MKGRVRKNGEELAEELVRLLGAPARVVITDNASSMVSAKKVNGSWTVRLHHMFERADEETLGVLGKFLTKPTRADRARLKSFFHSNSSLINENGTRTRRNPRIVTKGRHHDLKALLDRLNDNYFEGQAAPCRITWGQRKQGGKARSVRLGSYCAEQELIRIHPCLDRSFVPRYVVEGVVFHEILHHFIPQERKNGRRVIHSHRFRELERSYPHFDRMRKWQQVHLRRLLKPDS